MHLIKLNGQNKTLTLKSVQRDIKLYQTGRAGVAGPTGADGPAGPQGQQGNPGPAGADGVVQSIVAGTNVTVDSTDPANPIVSSSGGGSSSVDSVNGQTGTVVLDTDDISDSGKTNKYVTAAEKTILSNTSGVNTGDQDLSGLVPNTRTVNGHALSSNVTVTKSDVSLGNVDNTSDANKPISSATQTALNLKEDAANKGQSNGYASLDGGGKVPVTQLPNSIMEYQGTYNPNTNTPTLVNGTGNTGDVYLISANGSHNFGAGSITFKAGDYVVYDGSIWQRSINSNSIDTVFGRTGAVTAQNGDYTASQVTNVAAGNIASTDVQAAINELDTEKVPTTTTVNGHALSANVTVTKSDVGLGNVDNTSDATKNSAVATLTNKTLTSPAINTPTGIVKGDVGLGNVDNTSDATKNAASVTLTNKTISAPVITGTSTWNGSTSGTTTLRASAVAGTTALILPATNDTLITKTTTDVLTNKTLIASTNVTEEITSITSSATPTPTGGSLRNAFDVTALATGATFAAPSGSPVHRNKLWITIKDNGTAQTLAWNAVYTPGGVALPTTTILGKILNLGFIYNTNNALNKWQLVASAQEA